MDNLLAERRQIIKIWLNAIEQSLKFFWDSTRSWGFHILNYFSLFVLKKYHLTFLEAILEVMCN